jgi:hypothetical protein
MSRMELLQAAADRRLVGLTDVLDRAHVVWLEPDSSSVEASARDTRLVVELLREGLVQRGEQQVTVPWYGAGHAHGVRLLPTDRGRRVLGRLRDQFHLTTAAAAVVAGGGR